jgi:hypothetical protein
MTRPGMGNSARSKSRSKLLALLGPLAPESIPAKGSLLASESIPAKVVTADHGFDLPN